MAIMKTKKEWAKHIIKRFGKETALTYVNSKSSCPCKCVDRSCYDCTFREEDSLVCSESSEYFNEVYFYNEKIKKIKQKIKKKLWWYRLCRKIL